MTNTYALTDYDVYQEEAYDNYRSKRRLRRMKRRTRRQLKRKQFSKPKLSRPPVRSRPVKLPPIRVKTVSVIPKKAVIPKKPVIKTKKPLVKAKTPISHLIKKTNPTVVKKPLSAIAKGEVEQLQTAQVEASKKAMNSDGKVSKVIKVVAIVGVVGATGFGIYKFIQNKKLNNGHISTSK